MKIEICPVCGSPIEYMELTVLPPVPVKQCPSCGWRWEGKPEKIEYAPIEEGTTMKIEKVIKQLESILDHTRSMAASPDADEIWKEDSDALEFALTALRSMPKAGEPLSLEQLKQMDEKPVWIEDKEYPENTGWVIWDDSFKQNWLGDPETRNSHGKSWLAYSYPPAHIDRSEWISVKERLPKDFDQALVYDGDEHYPIGICHKDESGIWHSDMAYGMGTITHWMPLPEPPEEG